MTVVLDTNAYSDWRKDGRWNEIISTADRVLVPAVVLGELRAEFLRGQPGAENERKLVRYVSHPAVEVVPVVEASSRGYAQFKHQLRLAGKPIPENDVWIAALAVEHAALLLTSDAHFEHLPQVARAVVTGEA